MGTRRLLLAAGLLVLAGALATSASAQEQSDALVILPTNGDNVSAELRTALDSALAAEVAKRSDLNVIPTPKVDFIDLMFDAECVDADPECLANIGSSLGATEVVYAEARPAKTGAMVRIQKVRVSDKKELAKSTGKVTKDTVGALVTTASIALMGAIPAPPVVQAPVPPAPAPVKAKTGKSKIAVMFDSSPAGARVYINKKSAGKTPTRKRMKPGKYTVRIVKEGYQEELREVNVAGRMPVDLLVNLRPITASSAPVVVATAPTTPEPDEDDASAAPYYETWWFYTAIAAGAALTSVGIAAAAGAFSADPEPTGAVHFRFLEGADHDILLQSQRR